MLQTDLISDFALRRALRQFTRDEIPEVISEDFIERLVADSALVKDADRDAVIGELYQMVLEYHYEATKFAGFAAGSSSCCPLIVRQNSISMLRPLTGLEVVCSGFPVSKSGLNLSTESEKLLTGPVLLFNRIVQNSELLDLLEEKIGAGMDPLVAAVEMADDVELVIAESGEGEQLGSAINELLKGGTSKGGISENEGLLAPMLLALLTSLEQSPITKDSNPDATLNLQATDEKLKSMKILANTIR